MDYFQEGIPAPVPERTKEDVLLFFKLYSPEREELRYVIISGVYVLAAIIACYDPISFQVQSPI